MRAPDRSGATELSRAEMRDFCRLAGAEITTAKRAGALTPEDAARERGFVQELRMDQFRGARVYALLRDGEPVSINATRFSTGKRKNAWGRYVNLYLAYTRLGQRRQGHAAHLLAEVERNARFEGYDRLKSLAGSYAGFRLHLARGHTIWGLNRNGHLIVDHPLHEGAGPEHGIPENVRSYFARPIQTEPELRAALLDSAGLFWRAETADADVPSGTDNGLYGTREPRLGTP